MPICLQSIEKMLKITCLLLVGAFAASADYTDPHWRAGKRKFFELKSEYSEIDIFKVGV